MLTGSVDIFKYDEMETEHALAVTSKLLDHVPITASIDLTLAKAAFASAVVV